MKKLILALAAVVITIAACKTSKEAKKTETAKVETPAKKPVLDCNGTGLTFAAIKPIFDANCSSCHGYGGAGGYNFLSSTDVIRAAKNGDLLGTIKWLQGYPKMPERAEQLDQASIDKIECWINNGMKE